jgi:hypothetical protein
MLRRWGCGRRKKKGQGFAEELRSSFLKKRSKRLLSVWLGGASNSEPKWEKFFGSFLQKRTLP